MTYLLDTNVLSLSSPYYRSSAPNFCTWLDEKEENCFLSVVTLSEISFGIEKLRYQRATTKAGVLASWYQSLQQRFCGRVIPVSAEIGDKAGKFLADAIYRGVEISSEYAIIAATAAMFEYRVITYNWKDFETLPISVSTPEAVLPDAARD